MGNRDHLVEKNIVDKNGHQRRVRVSPHGKPKTDVRLTVPSPLSADNVPDLRNDAIETVGVSGEVFDQHFTPSKIRENAGRIYVYLNEGGSDADSDSRQALFHYAADSLGVEYNELHQKWKEGVYGILDIPKVAFDTHFTPEKILSNADRIDQYMDLFGGGRDADKGEELFTYAAGELRIDYDILHDKKMKH